VASSRKGEGGLLEHLLMPALEGALSLPEVDHVAVGVPQDLDFDVPGLDDELLDEDAVVAEGAFGLRPAGEEALVDLLVVAGKAQPLAAAAGGGLDHHGVADLPGDHDGTVGRFDGVVVPGDGVDPRLPGEPLGGDLVAQEGHGVMLGADEGNPFLLEAPGELLVLGEEAVARVDGLGARALAGGEEVVDHQVGFPGRRRADADRLVGQHDVAGVPVGLGVDGHGPDAHLAGGPDDAAGDLAAVGNQDGLEHVRSGSTELRND
jgi:hypothetical protein